jgi:hypothetical protein
VFLPERGQASGNPRKLLGIGRRVHPVSLAEPGRR